MSNWHNEALREAGWFTTPLETSNGKIGDEPTYPFPRGCRVCGTSTGEHGFSFDKPK